MSDFKEGETIYINGLPATVIGANEDGGIIVRRWHPSEFGKPNMASYPVPEHYEGSIDRCLKELEDE